MDSADIETCTLHAQGNPEKIPNVCCSRSPPAGFDQLPKYRAELLAKIPQDSPAFTAAMAAKQVDFDIERLGPTPEGLDTVR